MIQMAVVAINGGTRELGQRGRLGDMGGEDSDGWISNSTCEIANVDRVDAMTALMWIVQQCQCRNGTG